jgi:hypothetical protein
MTVLNRWSDEMDAPWNEPVYIGDSSEEVWTTKDEQHILVGDMSDTHVKNCYAMVKNTRSLLWQQIFKNELIKRGIYNEVEC